MAAILNQKGCAGLRRESRASRAARELPRLRRRPKTSDERREILSVRRTIDLVLRHFKKDNLEHLHTHCIYSRTQIRLVRCLFLLCCISRIIHLCNSAFVPLNLLIVMVIRCTVASAHYHHAQVPRRVLVQVAENVDGDDQNQQQELDLGLLQR